MGQIEEDIEKGSFHPVYLLYGEERFLVKEYRNRLRTAILGSEDEMNYSYFQGKDIDLSEVKDIGSTLPFFSDYRLLLMEETGFLKSSNDVAELISDFPESTIVLFVEREVDKRNKLYKHIAKVGLVSESGALSEKEAIAFVGKELWKGKKRVKESTAKYLIQQVDNSLYNLQNEVQKLIAYAYEREEVTKEDIDAVCCKEITEHMFHMLDAVAEGNSVQVLHYYKELIDLQESPLKILLLLYRHCNILLQIKTEYGNCSKQELAKKIGIRPFFLGKYIGQAEHFDVSQIREMLQDCVQTDYDFKRGKISDQMGLEILLMSFSGKRALSQT